MLSQGPLREILPRDTRTETVPQASGALVENCVACFYSNQNIEKTATLLRFRNRLIVNWQLVYTSNFGLEYR